MSLQELIKQNSGINCFSMKLQLKYYSHYWFITIIFHFWYKITEHLINTIRRCFKRRKRGHNKMNSNHIIKKRLKKRVVIKVLNHHVPRSPNNFRKSTNSRLFSATYPNESRTIRFPFQFQAKCRLHNRIRLLFNWEKM